MIIGTEFIHRFEQFASPQIAESWDHVGLQIGNPERPIHKMMTTLDVRPEIVDEAVEQGVDFIFAHHPVMFHAAKDLDTRDPQNAMYAKLLANNITVYAAHTNLDTANGGMNDWLADVLQLTDTTPLVPAGEDPVTGQPVGMGRVGSLSQPMTPADFADYCRERFGLKGVRLINHPDDDAKQIQRVAVLGGAGGDLYQHAVNAGADAYVTGDVSYHYAHDMIAHHLTVVDPGHHVEAVCEHQLAELFRSWQREHDGWDFAIIENSINTDPFDFIVK
ncbi:MAG: Nif3-like dinuclear metal center hexameric protein [Limosilactobacillus sp.]|uniref:Nif3-like dinuclear metal center hexameric protein n=1 Tax=Limosilactobacillus sp. TaxID=2773925 RepID=UPI002701D324|nr:Nif3-like dinuclear metal center hexameric protein [Limosilactobacillus sp.]